VGGAGVGAGVGSATHTPVDAAHVPVGAQEPFAAPQRSALEMSSVHVGESAASANSQQPSLAAAATHTFGSEQLSPSVKSAATHAAVCAQ
jgi:hypothetical protein